jgi:hypothetical protein
MGLDPVGRLPGSTPLRLSLGLPLRNPDQLTNLLGATYDRSSANYRQYLTAAQFTERFGPTENDYQSVIAFARTNGLVVGAADPSRMLVPVRATVSDIETVFHVNMQLYRHPLQQRLFFAPDVEPSLDLATEVLCISGMDNYVIPVPLGGPDGGNPVASPGGGSGPLGSLLGRDFRAAYAPQVSLTGRGEVIGLIEFDGYYPKDIMAYEQLAGLSTNTIITTMLVGSATGIPSTNANSVGEVSLDIEVALAMAPGVSEIRLYEGGSGHANDLLSAAANDLLAKQISSSWVYKPDLMTDQLLQRLAMQGQSFFQASGDDNAYLDGVEPKPHAGPPADDPYLTSVGGTVLTTAGPGGAWVRETVWNDYTSATGTNGTGGGVSTVYRIPAWQAAVNMSLNGGSRTMRNFPDVAMPAKNIWVIANDSHPHSASGTSCAAPLWAGFAALINEQCALFGRPPVGFLNPAIYDLCEGQAYGSIFHDITTGNNTNGAAGDTLYSAVPGFDLCTGWGSPNGLNLINALAYPDPLVVVPRGGGSVTGPVGGPLRLTVNTFSISNSGPDSVSWSASSLAPWLSASPETVGLLPAHAKSTITVALTPAANLLPASLSSGYLVISNLTSRTAQLRELTMQDGILPITFDDLVASTTDGEILPAGYAGFFWSNVYLLNGLYYTGNPSGYGAGTVSPQNVVYIPGGDPASIIGETRFDFLSAYLTAAWTDGLKVTAQGYTGGALAYSRTITLSATSPALVTFNYLGVDRVDFATAGGTNSPIVMDDVVAVIPDHAEPSPTLRPAVGALTWPAHIGYSYQVQCKTNLAQLDWTDVGAPVTALEASLTVTNLCQGAQAFYRLQLLP